MKKYNRIISCEEIIGGTGALSEHKVEICTDLQSESTG